MSLWKSNRNQIVNVYKFVSAPAAPKRDAFAERLRSACESASLLYKRIKDNTGYPAGTQRPLDVPI